MAILPLFPSLEGRTSYSIEDKPWPPHSSLLGDGVMAMVILPLFFWLEGQTSYYVEDKQWPPHTPLLGEGGNDHGHTLSLFRPRRATS